MMDISTFLEKYYPHASEQRISDVERFLSHIQAMVKDADLKGFLTDQTNLRKSFFIQQSNAISRQHYQKIKEYLLNLFDYYGIVSAVPTRSEVITSQSKKCFFRDLDSIFELIDKIGKDNIPSYAPNTDLVSVKSIIALGWYGFSTKEIAQMPKMNIIATNDSDYKVIRADSTLIEISKSAYDNLLSLSKIKEYRGIPSGKLCILGGDESFLFRPAQKNGSPITEGKIIQAIKRINKAIPDQDGIISFRNLKKNAMFVATYEENSSRTIVERIMEYMQCTANIAYGYKMQYEMWVNLFH